MSKSGRTLAAALVAAGIASVAHVASATPIADALAIKNAAPTTIEAVRWGGRGWGRGGGWGWGVGAGIVGGAIIGGALASPYYYGYGPYYPGPYYPAPGYYAAPVPGDGVAYCMRRFRSYDPRSGTYLGTDGYRHPCP